MRCLIISLVLLLSVFLFCSINAPEYKVLSDSSKALILVQHFDDSHTIKNYDGSIQFGQLFAVYLRNWLEILLIPFRGRSLLFVKLNEWPNTQNKPPHPSFL